MKIDDCVKCENHVLYQNGYVICTYYTMREQRITGAGESGTTYIVHCPIEEAAR